MSGSSSIAGPAAPASTMRSSRPASAPAFAPKVSYEALRLPSTLNFVAAGLGVSIVPELRRLNIEGVVYSALRGCDALTAPLNIVYRDSADGSTRRFIEHALANFAGEDGKKDKAGAAVI